MVDEKLYDVIVVGAGILGLACTNMLVQENDLSILNLSVEAEEQATLKNQNWLQSGAALLYDPVEDVPKLALDSYIANKRAMGLPIRKSRFAFRDSILTIPVNKEQKLADLTTHAATRYPGYFAKESGNQNCAFAEKLTDETELRARLGRHFQKGGAYYNVHDDSFRLTLLVNQLINGIHDQAGYENVFKVLPDHLQVGKVDGIWFLHDGQGGEFRTQKLLFCTGGGTMYLLEGLELETWEKEDLLNEGFEILRSPVLALENRSELLPGLFINARRDFAIMRHHTIQTDTPQQYQYATCHQDYHKNPNLTFSVFDSKVERLMKRITGSGVHSADDLRNGLFCNRLERRVDSPPSGCIAHTVSPFVHTFDSCEGLVIGLPGKATFALQVAAEMLIELGIDEPADLILGGYDSKILKAIHKVNEEPIRILK